MYSDTVVQIHTFSPNFNPLAPFIVSGTRQGLGSGFFVTPTIIMTAAHVVFNTYKDSGVKITIPSIGKDKMFSTRVITFIPEIDVALLIVTATDFNPRKTFFQMGDDRTLQPGTQLTVVGYPMGDNSLKVTRSTFNGLQDGVIQIDSSINPGNSGGPVLENNCVVGLVSSGYDPRMANSVAFAIPISVFLATLPLDPFKPTSDTRVLELPSLGIMYHNGTVTTYDTPDCKEGVIIQWISRYSALNPAIHVGDKLCSIICNNTEYKIDNSGDVKVSWYNSKIPLAHAVSTIPVNSSIQIRFWNENTKQVSTFATTLTPVFHGAFKPIYFPFEPFEYESFGGLIVTPLRAVQLAKFKQLFFKLSPDDKEDEKLVISYIVPSSLAAESGILAGGEILKFVNGKSVSTLSQYRELLKHPLTDTPDPHVQWITSDNEKMDLPLKALLNEEVRLTRDFNIPKSSVSEHINNLTAAVVVNRTN
jgi:S1-C subfamily serine protease